MLEEVVKTGLWIACGMIACVACILNDKKENGYAVLSIVDVILVAGGPLSLGIVCMVGLSRISIKI